MAYRILFMALLAFPFALHAQDTPAIVSRVPLNDGRIVVTWSDGVVRTNTPKVLGDGTYVVAGRTGQVLTNKVWWGKASSGNVQRVKEQPSAWLSADRMKALNRVATRPYVTGVKTEGKTSVYRWSDGKREWATTQAVSRVLGKPAKNAWRDKLDAKEKEKEEMLDELAAVKAKPTKKAIEGIITKHKGK